jgi:uncharacterized protein (DUF1697 family)
MEFAGVETFIASGNVIFDSPAADPGALERRVERHLRAALGYEVGTFIRTAAEVAEVAAHRPFPPAELEAEGATLYVAFHREPPGEAATRRLLEHRSAADDFHVRGREVYWLARKKVSESDFSGVQLARALGMPGTMRNVNTVRRLAAKYPPEA